MLADQGLGAAWSALPAPLRRRLALSSTGWRHLAQAAALCLKLARDGSAPAEAARLAALATDMLLWACGENPLHGPLATEILSAPELVLPASSRAVLSAVAANWRMPEAPEGSRGRGGGLAYFERLARQRDTAKLADFLAAQVKKDPASLFWREKALALSLFAGNTGLRAGREALSSEADSPEAVALEAVSLEGLDDIPGLAPVAAALRAQASFLRGDTSACLDALAPLHNTSGPLYGPLFGQGFVPARTGLALLAAGEDKAALPHLLRALRAAPWQANLAQVAADAATGLRGELAPLPGPTLVMLYTWNKAADLDATLTSLFASDLNMAGGGARVVVLDNGSTDSTPQVLDAWAQRAGENLLRVTLPVNIGAPAARNWLAALPEARAAEYLVYLDDDVDLPAHPQGNWLGRLGAALKHYPHAGVVGCKVADHHAPHLLQNVAGHLMIPQEAPEDRPDLAFQSLSPNPFRLCDAHLQGPDWGLFDFISPCASVTGCCHLFRRKALIDSSGAPAAAGGFSLALGPSQYDDFERDLRMLDSGAKAVYTGHLRVRHRKRSGLASQGGGQGGGQGVNAAGAGAAGNRYKMQCMHPRADIARHIDAQAEWLEAHQLDRLRALDALGPGE
ncbi:MAG: glycosyltransferase [Humidesulfovibrio sp.]|nr:glycosyltransferase [Humidesulfovibrio sp.]